MKVRVLAILVMTGLHFILSVTLLLTTVTMGITASMDGQGPVPATLAATEAVTAIILFPVFFPLAVTVPQAFPGLLGYIPMLANSLVWALLLIAAGRGLARLHARLHDRDMPLSTRG